MKSPQSTYMILEALAFLGCTFHNSTVYIGRFHQGNRGTERCLTQMLVAKLHIVALYVCMHFITLNGEYLVATNHVLKPLCAPSSGFCLSRVRGILVGKHSFFHLLCNAQYGIVSSVELCSGPLSSPHFQVV